MRPLLATRAGRVVAACVALVVVGTLAGHIALWPSDGTLETPGGELQVTATQRAEVSGVQRGGCEAFAGPNCKIATVELLEGADRGRETSVTISGDLAAPRLAPGDEIRVARNLADVVDPDLAEVPLDLADPAAQAYSFVDFERRAPMLWLALVFAVVVVALGRWQGLRSLIALGVSLALVLAFVVPATLDGRAPLLVAVVGGLGIVLVTMALTHGPGLKTAAALLGTTASLLLTALLATLAVGAVHITGASSEEATLLAGSSDARLSLQGLVLAGIVIGSLGVLDDVTISQASTVLALRRVNSQLSARALAAEALTGGRDHLTATVNTLVLAYVGAALPVLLIFATQDLPLGEAVNREVVAEEVVAMLVGSIGLVAAVPLTTALAAVLARSVPAELLPEDAHEHHHH